MEFKFSIDAVVELQLCQNSRMRKHLLHLNYNLILTLSIIYFDCCNFAAEIYIIIELWLSSYHAFLSKTIVKCKGSYKFFMSKHPVMTNEQPLFGSLIYVTNIQHMPLWKSLYSRFKCHVIKHIKRQILTKRTIILRIRRYIIFIT